MPRTHSYSIRIFKLHRECGKVQTFASSAVLIKINPIYPDISDCTFNLVARCQGGRGQVPLNFRLKPTGEIREKSKQMCTSVLIFSLKTTCVKKYNSCRPCAVIHSRAHTVFFTVIIRVLQQPILQYSWRAFHGD